MKSSYGGGYDITESNDEVFSKGRFIGTSDSHLASFGDHDAEVLGGGGAGKLGGHRAALDLPLELGGEVAFANANKLDVLLNLLGRAAVGVAARLRTIAEAHLAVTFNDLGLVADAARGAARFLGFSGVLFRLLTELSTEVVLLGDALGLLGLLLLVHGVTCRPDDVTCGEVLGLLDDAVAGNSEVVGVEVVELSAETAHLVAELGASADGEVVAVVQHLDLVFGEDDLDGAVGAAVDHGPGVVLAVGEDVSALVRDLDGLAVDVDPGEVAAVGHFDDVGAREDDDLLLVLGAGGVAGQDDEVLALLGGGVRLVGRHENGVPVPAHFHGEGLVAESVDSALTNVTLSCQQKNKKVS